MKLTVSSSSLYRGYSVGNRKHRTSWKVLIWLYFYSCCVATEWGHSADCEGSKCQWTKKSTSRGVIWVVLRLERVFLLQILPFLDKFIKSKYFGHSLLKFCLNLDKSNILRFSSITKNFAHLEKFFDKKLNLTSQTWKLFTKFFIQKSGID